MTINLRLYGRSLNKESLEQTLNLARSNLNELLLEHGTGELPAMEEEFTVQSPDAVVLIIRSNRRQKQRLTYIILGYTVSSLIELLITRKNYQEAHFTIFLENIRVGSGAVS